MFFLVALGSVEAALRCPGAVLAGATFLSRFSCFLPFRGFLWCHIDLIRLRCAAFKLADRLAKAAADFGQLFPTKDDERDDQDDHQFLQT